MTTSRFILRGPLPTTVALAMFVLLGVGSSARAEQPRFYLSTQRVFSPSDKDIAVQLEARGLESLDLRLYRIGDPLKFFLEQDDLHRVATQNGPKRSSSLDVLSELHRLTMESALDMGRSELTEKTRAAGRDAFAEQVEHVRTEANRVAPPATAVPLLRDFQLVDMWREDLTGEGSGWVYQQVSITARRPGVYLLEGVYGHEVGYTVVIVSKMVLLTRQSKEEFLVYAADPDLGKPIADAQIELFLGKKPVAKGATDEDGLWSKSIPLHRKLTAFARRGDDFALVDPTYHPANLFSRKVYLTTERPVYRPGQEVFYKGIIRSYVDERYRQEKDLGTVSVTIRDPNGQQVHQAQMPANDFGSFDGAFNLFDKATLGTYRILANIDDTEFAGEFKVKAYRKPEYKVRVKTERKAYSSGANVSATIAANYFFGPPVAGAKVKASVYRTRFYIPWWVDADYSWYYSDAEYRNTMREIIEEKEGRLDEKGEFHFDFETLADSLDYTYAIQAVVSDASGQAVSGHGSIRVTRAQYRLTLEPDRLLNSPGQEARILVSSTDYGRNPVPAEVQVVISGKLGSDPASAKTVPVLTRKVSTGDKGQAWLSFKPEKGGTYSLAASSTDEQGNKVEHRTTLFVTDDGGDIPYAPSDLEIVADKRTYHVGDKARFLILSPHANAHLLISVEGGRLYGHKVLRAKGHSAVFEIEVEEAQSPNFFLRVATVFDSAVYHKRLDVVVPPREKLLQVAIVADKPKARPGDEVRITVAVKDFEGQAVENAEVALGLVDEAIYGISPEIAVPITRFFYHRKRNDVRSTSSLDFRFYGYGEDTKDKMAALHLRQAVVPGSFKAAASSRIRKKFKDTLAWQPRLKTDSKGEAVLKVKVPDNLTTWRATARVATSDTRVGQGTGSFQVSKPVVVRVAAPGFMVEGDKGKLGLLVHNYTAEKQDFKVSIKSKGQHLEIKGENKTVTVVPGGLGVLAWDARALLSGTAKIQASARADSVSDSVEHNLPVRAYGVEQTLLASGVLDDLRPTALVAFKVPDSAGPDSIRTTVNVSSGVAPALLASLEYLTGYPYGCTEQTMSRFLPDLVVAQALGDLGFKNEKLEEDLPGFIHAGLARLAQLQHSDGGWGWWENDKTDAHMTAYVVHGLALAKRMNQTVDEDMLNRGTNRLKHLVRSSRLDHSQRTYLLYSLALAGVKYGSMMDKLADDPSKLSEYGKALLAMGLFELGQKEKAAQLAGQIDLAAHTSARGAHWGTEGDRPGWQNDPVETTAAALRSLLISKPDSVNIPAAVQWLMSMREGNRWSSTRDTAMAVFALVDYLKKAGGSAYQATVNAQLNGKASKPRSFGRKEMFKPSIALLTEHSGRIGDNQIKLEREGKGALFYNASLSYFGRENPIAARGDRLQIERKLHVVERQPTGSGWRFKIKPLSGPVRSGQEILVELVLRCSQRTDYVMISDPFAGGVQPIERDKGYKIPGFSLQQRRMHREFHDDHAAFFVSNLAKGTRKLAYLVRATLPGEYNLLPARVLPMYDPHFAGNSKSMVLKVED